MGREGERECVYVCVCMCVCMCVRVCICLFSLKLTRYCSDYNAERASLVVELDRVVHAVLLGERGELAAHCVVGQRLRLTQVAVSLAVDGWANRMGSTR